MFFQFEIIISVLVSSFRYRLWVIICGQNATSTDVRFRRLKTVPALRGLFKDFVFYIDFVYHNPGVCFCYEATGYYNCYGAGECTVSRLGRYHNSSL